MQDIVQIDLETASKGELKAALKTIMPQMTAFRDSVARLLRQPSAVPAFPTGHPDDSVPAGWPHRHGSSSLVQKVSSNLKPPGSG